MFMIRLRIFLLFDQFYLLIHRWLKVEVYRLNEKEGRSPRSIRIIYILDFHFSFHSLLFFVPSWFRTIHTLFPHTHTHTHALYRNGTVYTGQEFVEGDTFFLPRRLAIGAGEWILAIRIRLFSLSIDPN